MSHFAQLVDVMQSVAEAIEEQKQLLFCCNTQLIQLLGLCNVTPAFYKMFQFHQFGWEVRDGAVYVYAESGRRIVVCGAHLLMRYPELGLSALARGQNVYVILDDSKRKP
jgi:hypothetical protein